MHNSHPGQFNIEHVASTPYSLTLKVTLHEIQLDSASTIILNIYEQDHVLGKENLKKIGNVYLNYPFKELYTIEDLIPLTNYKMNFFLTIKQSTYHSTVFANTKNDPQKPKDFKALADSSAAAIGSNGTGDKKKVLSRTEELLYKYTEAKSTNLPIYRDSKDLKKNILDARSAKEWKEYQSSGFKFAKPKKNFETRKKRIWLVASGFEVFDQVADIVKREKGFNVMEGDWFMGPFYSYDYNHKKKIF